MKRILASTAVIGLAIAGIGTASAQPAVNKVTGGGQTLVPESGGAGDTIAFSAQSQGNEGADAKGQFQYVDREGGTGQNQTVTHGTVTCVVIFADTRSESGGAAVIGGMSRDGVPFRIDVTDNGSGAQGTDMILVRQGEAAEDSDGSGDSDLCDEDDAPSNPPVLNRGNVTVHKAKS